jgi:hypothetical protein
MLYAYQKLVRDKRRASRKRYMTKGQQTNLPPDHIKDHGLTKCANCGYPRHQHTGLTTCPVLSRFQDPDLLCVNCLQPKECHFDATDPQGNKIKKCLVQFHDNSMNVFTLKSVPDLPKLPPIQVLREDEIPPDAMLAYKPTPAQEEPAYKHMGKRIILICILTLVIALLWLRFPAIYDYFFSPRL